VNGSKTTALAVRNRFVAEQEAFLDKKVLYISAGQIAAMVAPDPPRDGICRKWAAFADIDPPILAIVGS
jgi:hypothetical protein